jgi:predicted lipoprotein with Yx(FWY)xxD motif
MKILYPMLFLIALVTAMVVISGCTQNQSAAPVSMPAAPATIVQAPAATPAMSSDTVRLGDTSLGKILVDSTGKTLYYFATDTASSGASTCYGKCATIWPVFSVNSIVVSPPLDPADFSTITRTDGTKQVTYYGWPLYYFQKDAAPGDVKGENVLKTWFVVKPDEAVLIAQKDPMGLYLTDTSGKTLYYFSRDTPGTTACGDACIAKWPVFRANPVTAPSVLKLSDFSSLKRSDGVMQTAYMDHPLYYFSGDSKPGDTKGQGFAGVWSVANVSGFIPVMTPPPTATPTPVPTTIDYGSDSGGSGGGGGGGY